MRLAGGAGDRGRAGVGLQGPGVGEAVGVVAEFGEDPCTGRCPTPGKLVMICACGCCWKMTSVAWCEVLGGGDGGVETGQRRPARPDRRRPRPRRDAAWPRRGRCWWSRSTHDCRGCGARPAWSAAIAAGPWSAGRPRRVSVRRPGWCVLRGWRRPMCLTWKAVNAAGKYSRSSERSWLAACCRCQVASWPARASTATARTRSLSLGNGRCACRSVRSTFASIRASAASDLDRATVVRSPVPGRGHRVDHHDVPPGRDQTGDQQATAGLDGHRDQVLWCVAVLGQQLEQLAQGRPRCR